MVKTIKKKLKIWDTLWVIILASFLSVVLSTVINVACLDKKYLATYLFMYMYGFVMV